MKNYYVIVEDIKVSKEQYQALRKIDFLIEEDTGKPLPEGIELKRNFLQNKIDDGTLNIFGFMDEDKNG